MSSCRGFGLARDGKNQRLTQLAEERFLAWPPAQDNSVLRLARQRLLGRQPGTVGRSAAGQQGLLQIVRDFCDHSNAVCADCMFPDMVRQVNEQQVQSAVGTVK